MEIGFDVDGEIELFEWRPIVLFTNPHARRVWDIGPVDFGADDLVWLRSLRLKALARADLTVTVYFQGTAKTAQTVSVNGGLNQITHYEVPLGRDYKGRQPTNVIVSSTSAFNLYWMEFRYRGSGGEVQKKLVRVSGEAK